MNGFALLLGHLIGDYILQNDWMAANKTSPPPTPMDIFSMLDEGHAACTAHCLCYTLAVWLCSFWWMPWWGLLLCFGLHWPIDRFRLARVWMERISGQKAFANGPLAPWSVIVVDNVFHLATLYTIALAAGVG